MGLCAAALAFGRVSSVLQSIERLLAVMGGQPAAYVRHFDPERHGAAFADLVHRWTRGPDLVALVWIMKQMIDRAGSIEAFFLEGYDPAAEDVEDGARQLFDARAGARSAVGLRKGAEAPGGLLLLPASVRRERLQAAESVPAMDGPA